MSFPYFPEVIGHRGVRKHPMPENSIAAFREAINQGAGGIELDARVCASGEIVVFHDKTLEALTNGKGRVKLTDFEKLRSLRLKQEGVIAEGWRDHIPTLDEVLDSVQSQLRINKRFLVNIEIKGKDSPEKIVEIVQKRLDGGAWKPDNFTISHFHHERLQPVKEHLPQIKLGLLFSQMGRNHKRMYDVIMPEAEKWGAASANLPIECYMKGNLAERLKQNGLAPVAWTMDEKRSHQRVAVDRVDPYARIVAEQGVSLITDYPREMIQEIKNARYELGIKQREL